MEKSVEKAAPQQEEAAFAPLPGQEGAVGGMGVGKGDETGEAEVAAFAMEADSVAEGQSVTNATEAVSVAVVTESLALPGASRVMTKTMEESSVLPPEPLPTRVVADDWGAEGVMPVATFPPPWLAGVFGIATLLLAGVTIWMSRKQ